MPEISQPNSKMKVKNRLIPSLNDAPDIVVRIFQLSEQSGHSTPALLWIHGGGFGARDIDHPFFKQLLETIVLETGMIIVAPEYRLAPADPFPAAPDDCYATFQWLLSSIEEYRIDPNRIMIGGASAGGCIAIATALMARDKGDPNLYFQFLIEPVTDNRFSTVSSQSVTDPEIFNSASLRECWVNYLGGKLTNDSPYAAPALADDLSGLPPAYIFVAERDPVRDEGIEYANRLMQAGISTELHLLPNIHHVSIAESQELSTRVLDEFIAVLKRISNAKY
jgi:acetyl esterase